MSNRRSRELIREARRAVFAASDLIEEDHPVVAGKLRDLAKKFTPLLDEVSSSRNFGVCIMQRDEPLDVPPRVDPIPYYRESLDEAIAKQRTLETMTVAEASRKAKAEHREHVASNKGFRERHAKHQQIYGEMLAKAKAWAAPSADHAGLKKFMIEQLEMSMPFGEPYQCDETLLTGAQWLDRARKRAADDVRYHSEKWREHDKAVKRGQLWLDELHASLHTEKGDVK